jgi:multisubunit Na+/H+ antiporter MnhF subunit
MTFDQVCVLILLVGGLGPVIALGATGSPTNRLIGLELGTVVVTVLFLLLAQIADQSYELILPLVLVPLSFAGALVYTRILSRREVE